MPDYQNGKIYKLVNDENDDIYYGSTSAIKLSKRFGDHKRSYKRYLNGKGHFYTSFNILKYPSCKIILVEDFPCKSKYELEARERYYIEKYKCVNKIKPSNKISSYETGKIYKLVNDETDHEYYGSTIQTLKERYNDHKRGYRRYLNGKCEYMSSYEIVKYLSYKIILVENFPCKSKYELEVRERYYIENFKCVNKTIPTRSDKEWRDQNKDILKEKSKQWRDENKDKRKQDAKEYYEKNKEKCKEKQKYYRLENNEKISKKQKQYRLENKEKQKEYGKQYRLKNKEKIKQEKKQYGQYRMSWGGTMESYNCNLLKIDPYLFL